MNVWVLIDRDRFSGVYTTAESAMQWFERNHAYLKVEFKWNQDGEHAWRMDKECKMGHVDILQCPVFEPPCANKDYR